MLNLNGDNKYDKWCIRAEDILNKKFSCTHLAGLCINEKKINSILVNLAHEHNMEIFTYSCNTEKQLKKLLALELDGIMTDKSEWLTKRISNETGN